MSARIKLASLFFKEGYIATFYNIKSIPESCRVYSTLISLALNKSPPFLKRVLTEVRQKARKSPARHSKSRKTNGWALAQRRFCSRRFAKHMLRIRAKDAFLHRECLSSPEMQRQVTGRWSGAINLIYAFHTCVQPEKSAFGAAFRL